MSKLKYFNKQTYSSLSEALGAIRKELEALQPQDSTDVVWSKSAEGISAKVRNGIIGEESQPIITESDDGDSVTAATYNGMHKLVLITNNSNSDSHTYKVCVCDGATYNPYTHVSDDSVVYVNGFIFNIKSQVFTISNNYNLVYIKFTAGSMTAAPKVEYVMTQRHIFNEDNTAYYLVGSVTQHETGICTVNQVHIGGNGSTAANMTYGVICGI